MDLLYAPWRGEYLDEGVRACPFCLAGRGGAGANLTAEDEKAEDERLGLLYRAEHCFAIMNRYPYSPGHFMLIPYAHIENIEDLPAPAWAEMSELVRLGVGILRQDCAAAGVNIGMNLGAAAGAGIAAHCHYHLVPRWEGDSNFITTIARTRVIGKELFALAGRLREAFARELGAKAQGRV